MKLQDNNGRGCLASSMIAFLSFPAINQFRFQSIRIPVRYLFKRIGKQKVGRRGVKNYRHAYLYILYQISFSCMKHIKS